MGCYMIQVQTTYGYKTRSSSQSSCKYDQCLVASSNCKKKIKSVSLCHAKFWLYYHSDLARRLSHSSHKHEKADVWLCDTYLSTTVILGTTHTLTTILNPLMVLISAKLGRGRGREGRDPVQIWGLKIRLHRRGQMRFWGNCFSTYLLQIYKENQANIATLTL